ncbi:MAG: hypothetical protein HYT16_03815 [DPANN group archaeon]|nr:hypothetical protein [DPANN group archaeon]
MKLKTAHNLKRAMRAAMVFGPLAFAGLNALMQGAGAEQAHAGLVHIVQNIDPSHIQIFGHTSGGGLEQIASPTFYGSKDGLDVAIQPIRQMHTQVTKCVLKMGGLQAGIHINSRTRR